MIWELFGDPKEKKLVQRPCNLGILHSMKNKYKHFFLHSSFTSTDVSKSRTSSNSLVLRMLSMPLLMLGIDLPTLANVWHGFWATRTFENDLADEGFEGFKGSNEKIMISNS